MISGIDHVALITANMKATVHFYRDLLGLPLILKASSPNIKHYNFRCGENVVAFFQYLDKEPAPHPPRPHTPGPHAPHGADHLALRIENESDFNQMVNRLEDAAIELRGPIDHGTAMSVYFLDNNGIALELTVPKG